MSTWTALTTLDDKAAAERLGDALETLEPAPTGVGVFEIEDGTDTWEVGAYFLEKPSQVELAIFAKMYGARDFVVSEVPDTDWVAHVRRDLAPVEAGSFFVYGAHDADRVPSDKIALRIEASMAFGTGHHGTTLGCLRALQWLEGEGAQPASIIDIGCGTAVLAMASACIWPEARIIATDIDPVAIEVAEVNLAANGMADRIECFEAAGLDHDKLKGDGRFQLVFANILKGPLLALAEDIARSTAISGHAILSGILNEQADEVANYYAQFGFNTVRREEIVDWTTLILAKIS